MINSYSQGENDIVELHCDKELCYNSKTIKNPTKEKMQDTGWYQFSIEHSDGSTTEKLYCPTHAGM
jgi:hypothetical protein